MFETYRTSAEEGNLAFKLVRNHHLQVTLGLAARLWYSVSWLFRDRLPIGVAVTLPKVMTSRLAAGILCAGAIALACGPRTRSATATAPQVTTPVPQNSSIEPALATTLDVSVSSGVTLALHVTNKSDSKVELRFPSGQTHEFLVLDAGGREVWRWSFDRMFTQSLQTRLLDSDETLTVEGRWDPGALSGKFTAVAKLTSTTHQVEKRVEFTLP